MSVNTALEEAVKAIVDKAPELTDTQGAQLRQAFGTPAWDGDDLLLREAYDARSGEGDGPHAGVYLVKSGAWIKIGISNNIHSRMASFKTSNPEPYRLVGFIPVPRLGDRRALEANLHKQFADSRKAGTEWFSITPSLLSWIATNQKAGVIQ